ncbi:DUF4432 family protein [Kribbella sp. NBC_00662]|uniref:DUF4432 family protein n=1 Tax=Kribbella sp. NBC_00662 TaxID=2975969 RepID=UPI003250BF6E
MSVPPSDAVLVLRSPQLEVVVLPDKGADVYSVIDRATGIDVLFKSPWGWRDPATVPPMGESQADWLARYPGGWQLLVPNAGPEREYDGVLRGFHGEAAVITWNVDEWTATTARLSTDLATAPLHLEREFVADGPDLEVVTLIRNTSPRTVPVMCVEHAAFGAPFLDARCRLDTSARRIAAASGYDKITDFAAVPPPGALRSVFAGLADFAAETGFAQTWVSIASPSAGFGIRMAWDSATLPHAWLWEEAGGVLGYPWFGRAYVAGVEPANVLPDDGLAETPLLGAHQEWRTTVTLSRFEL